MIRRKLEPGISWLKVQVITTKILLLHSPNIYFLCNLLLGTLNHSIVWQFVSYPTLNAIDKETLSWIQRIIYPDEENRLSLPAGAFINMLDILRLIYEYAARHQSGRKWKATCHTLQYDYHKNLYFIISFKQWARNLRKLSGKRYRYF